MSFLLVLDFDHTVVDDNTDVVVQRLEGRPELSKEVRAASRSQGWTRQGRLEGGKQTGSPESGVPKNITSIKPKKCMAPYIYFFGSSQWSVSHLFKVI